MGLFHQILEGLERVLYFVDEWLRFRRGEHRVHAPEVELRELELGDGLRELHAGRPHLRWVEGLTHGYVVVDVFSELVVDFARKHSARTMIKGLRVIGYQNAERFLKTLSLATAP